MLNKISVYPIIFILLVSMLLGCGHGREAAEAMEAAEAVMQSSPDSALQILSGIGKDKLVGAEQKARHALLMSMALDKNYIDTTTFDVLQPAIDYYLQHGTSDEKLRTLYYQGRIFMNQGDDESAMQSFFKALDEKEKAVDYKMLAQTLVAQGELYVRQYQAQDYLNNNLGAAKIYRNLGEQFLEASCLQRSINGCVLTENEGMADSLISKLGSLSEVAPECRPYYNSAYIQWKVQFGTNDEIRNILNEYEITDLSRSDALCIVDGYTKIGEYGKALGLMAQIVCGESVRDSLRYNAIMVDIFENLNQYECAFNRYKEFSLLLDEYQKEIFTHDLLFAENRHQLEIENLRLSQSREFLKLLSASIAVILLITVSWLYYRYRLIKSERTISEIENEKMRISQRQGRMEMDNLRLEKSMIEDERNSLKELLAEQVELSKPIKDAIKTRLDMLNSLLAKAITNNVMYAQPYEKWIELVRTNREEFMSSTRLAFRGSHPMFFEYLDKYELTSAELDYICLCAMGLRGKEIGEFIQLKRHYNISSSIRKKMKIDSNETNLGIFVRRLMEGFDG